MTVTLADVVRFPNRHFRVSVWDVRWSVDGWGKHGTGPFATEAQALACLRSVGWPGEVHRCRVVLSGREVYRIFRGRELPFLESGCVQEPLL